MYVQTNIPLSQLTTMRIGGNASYVVDVTTPDELRQAYQNAKQLNLPAYIIGGGSNLIAHDEGFNGVIVRNLIGGIEIVSDDASSITIKAGGGMKWDDLVKFSVEHGLYGIACMSGIPGTVGAAPVQNIGAYGQELAETMVSLEAYDLQQDAFVQLERADCGFSYRSSIFRTTEVGHYAIYSVTLQLPKAPLLPPFYESLQKRLEELGVTEYTAQTIRDNVLAIRTDKLPDPSVLPNAGSFFKNAVVESWKAEEIRNNGYSDLPTYAVDETYQKIPAGWLIEQSDLKGDVLHGIKIHSKNAVVLINESATGYEDLQNAKAEIIKVVQERFQITLEQEPLELTPPEPLPTITVNSHSH